MTLYRDNKHEINNQACCYNEKKKNGTLVITEYLESGTYYIRVSNPVAEAKGNYSIKAKFNPLITSDKEPNDSIETAQLISASKSDIFGLLSKTDQFDYYYFNVTEEGSLQFKVESKIKGVISVDIQREDGSYSKSEMLSTNESMKLSKTFIYNQVVPIGKYIIRISLSNIDTYGIFKKR